MNFRRQRGIYQQLKIKNSITQQSTQTSFKNKTKEQTKMSLNKMKSSKNLHELMHSQKKLRFHLFRQTQHTSNSQEKHSQIDSKNSFQSYYGQDTPNRTSAIQINGQPLKPKEDKIKIPSPYQTSYGTVFNLDKKQARQTHQIPKFKKTLYTQEALGEQHKRKDQKLPKDQKDNKIMRILSKKRSHSKANLLMMRNNRQIGSAINIYDSEKHFEDKESFHSKKNIQIQQNIHNHPQLKIKQRNHFSDAHKFKVNEEDHILPDMNRSIAHLQKRLQKRKQSTESRTSRIREQMSLALESNSSGVEQEQFHIQILKMRKDQELTAQKRIHLHLQILQSLSNFVYESTKFDEKCTQEWEELNFLVYKKFYIERQKVLNFIKKYPMKNPFRIYRSQVTIKQVVTYFKSADGQKQKIKIIEENEKIKQNLINFYNNISKDQVGEKINLFEYDNFSHWIIEQLWAELILTEYDTDHSEDAINTRLLRILQVTFLISELNGKFETSFQEGEQAIQDGTQKQYIKDGKQIFQKYILQKS